MASLSAFRVVTFAALAALLCAAATLAADRLSLPVGAGACLVAAVPLGFGALAAALVDRAQSRGRDRTAALAELRELLQVSGSEAESRQLLLRHVQRLLPRAGAAVLTRFGSEDRLVPTLGERIADTPLRAFAEVPLPAEACLALRLGRRHQRGEGLVADPDLPRCELCDRCEGEVACEPLRVAGRTLGSVVVACSERIGLGRRDHLHEAVAAAAPVLAIQRNLEVTDRRAATDPLTGLPNRLSAERALLRMSAQAGRTVSPLAAVCVDIDRFSAINDRFGHEQGDAALTILARALSAGVRASDFVARYGGDEFLVLAPDTGRPGATDLAEKLRREVEQLLLPGVGQLTASFGVAALPDDSLDAEQLLIRASGALATAKAFGRNRVQGAQATPASDG